MSEELCELLVALQKEEHRRQKPRGSVHLAVSILRVCLLEPYPHFFLSKIGPRNRHFQVFNFCVPWHEEFLITTSYMVITDNPIKVCIF